MALSDHFREARARLIRSALLLVIAFCVAIFCYDQLLDLVNRPYLEAQEALRRNGTRTTQVVQDATGGLLLQMKLCGVVGPIIASSPYWLYQIWAFILPGLHPREKRYTRLFAAVAGPLFLGGVALGYYVLPKILEVLSSPSCPTTSRAWWTSGASSPSVRMLLIFGVSMEIPLFVVLLNPAGVVSGHALAKRRPWIVIGTMVFAAVATPSTNPSRC